MKLRLGYLGPAGTYTQEAANKAIGELDLRRRHDIEVLPFYPIPTLFTALNDDDIRLAVVPRRNNLAGDYVETVQELAKYDFGQIHQVNLQIRLAIGIHRDSDQSWIDEIWSKDTALKECSRYLDRHFASARRVEVPSTGYAMREVASGLPNVAAVGSIAGMELYGLNVLNDDIGNQKENFTQFLVLEKQGAKI